MRTLEQHGDEAWAYYKTMGRSDWTLEQNFKACVRGAVSTEKALNKAALDRAAEMFKGISNAALVVTIHKALLMAAMTEGLKFIQQHHPDYEGHVPDEMQKALDAANENKKTIELVQAMQKVCRLAAERSRAEIGGTVHLDKGVDLADAVHELVALGWSEKGE